MKLDTIHTIIFSNPSMDIGIDTNIEVIVVSWDNNDRNWGINFYSIMMKLN